ncbi:hypothetical protein JKP88DRAFT_285410 [Tribonema minus]|uniref:Uncharacterized protein n=1 Tax=Tribonema minus TaxID=303371 RepID=A0A835ZFB9_9STRA|nr:hypothetical protein JKP88DRAFT_285410 [Tribonema minus]
MPLAPSKKGGKGRRASKRALSPSPGSQTVSPHPPRRRTPRTATATRPRLPGPDTFAEALDRADVEEAGNDEHSKDAEEGGDKDAKVPLSPPALDLHDDSFAMATTEEILTGLHACATGELERLNGWLVTLDSLHAALVESGIGASAYSTALAKAAHKANVNKNPKGSSKGRHAVKTAAAKKTAATVTTAGTCRYM